MPVGTKGLNIGTDGVGALPDVLVVALPGVRPQYVDCETLSVR
jgi:hypothetical protein